MRLPARVRQFPGRVPGTRRMTPFGPSAHAKQPQLVFQKRQKEAEREREREREREADRQTDRQTDRETEKEREERARKRDENWLANKINRLRSCALCY